MTRARFTRGRKLPGGKTQGYNCYALHYALTTQSPLRFYALVRIHRVIHRLWISA